MTYTVELEKCDTECLRQTVTEAFNAGETRGEASDDQTKINCGDYYGRLLQQIEHQAQHIAERAFKAGQLAPELKR